MARSGWTCPGLLFEKHANRTLELALPQITELGRLLNFSEVDDLKRFAWERSAVRAQRWFPVPCLCKNGGLLYVYPGDDLYPDEPDFEGQHPPVTIPFTIEEARTRFPKHNPNEIVMSENGPVKTSTRCNVKLADGQVTPISRAELVMQRRSVL